MTPDAELVALLSAHRATAGDFSSACSCGDESADGQDQYTAHLAAVLTAAGFRNSPAPIGYMAVDPARSDFLDQTADASRAARHAYGMDDLLVVALVPVTEGTS